MPVLVVITDPGATEADFEAVFAYLTSIDETFSTYKDSSEIMRINRGEIVERDYSDDVKEVFRLSEETKTETAGYFDIGANGMLDPSGLVKGWAIHNAAELLRARGRANFFVDIGGDVQAHGVNAEGRAWTVGIRDPFSSEHKIVKRLRLRDMGIATSGTYLRGQHIWNPDERSRAVARPKNSRMPRSDSLIDWKPLNA